MDLESKVKARIEKLEKDREAYVLQANQQIAAFQGAIGELKALLEPEESPGAPRVSASPGNSPS